MTGRRSCTRAPFSALCARWCRAWLCAAVVALLLTGCSASTADPDPDDLTVLIEPDVEEYLADADPAGQVRAVLVHHDGVPLLERYHQSDPGQWWDTRSVTKSVLSSLIGIAIGEGLIDGVDATLGELLPGRRDEMTDEVAALTLHQILTHTAGFGEEGTGADDYWRSEDWVGSILATRAEAGAHDGTFAYSNAGAHLMSAVLVEASGAPVLEYAREELFEPLGIPSEPAFEPTVDLDDPDAEAESYARYVDGDFAWGVDPQGLHEGSCCMKLRPEDLARLGQLYLDDGRWDGKQILPADWVKEATRPQVEASFAATTGYGYMWWTTEIDGQPAFVAYGRGGQVIEVVPDLGLVVVVATEIDDRDPLLETKTFGRETAMWMVELSVAPHIE